MAKIIAIANQKGGVGKTTTCVNLAASLAAMQKRVLVVDSDPQGNATMASGINKFELINSICQVLIGDVDIRDCLITETNGSFHLLPANEELTAAEVRLLEFSSREFRLKNALALLENDYDYIFIDCPPSLNLLTVNAMCAAHSIIVPLQCEYFALEGLTLLIDTVDQLAQAVNPDLKIEGILRTMFDNRNRLSSDVSEELKRNFGDLVYKTIIPRNVRLAEAPSFGKPAMYYDKASVGAKAYLALAGEMVEKDRLEAKALKAAKAKAAREAREAAKAAAAISEQQAAALEQAHQEQMQAQEQAQAVETPVTEAFAQPDFNATTQDYTTAEPTETAEQVEQFESVDPVETTTNYVEPVSEQAPVESIEPAEPVEDVEEVDTVEAVESFAEPTQEAESIAEPPVEEMVASPEATTPETEELLGFHLEASLELENPFDAAADSSVEAEPATQAAQDLEPESTPETPEYETITWAHDEETDASLNESAESAVSYEPMYEVTNSGENAEVVETQDQDAEADQEPMYAVTGSGENAEVVEAQGQDAETEYYQADTEYYTQAQVQEYQDEAQGNEDNLEPTCQESTDESWAKPVDKADTLEQGIESASYDSYDNQLEPAVEPVYYQEADTTAEVEAEVAVEPETQETAPTEHNSEQDESFSDNTIISFAGANHTYSNEEYVSSFNSSDYSVAHSAGDLHDETVELASPNLEPSEIEVEAVTEEFDPQEMAMQEAVPAEPEYVEAVAPTYNPSGFEQSQALVQEYGEAMASGMGLSQEATQDNGSSMQWGYQSDMSSQDAEQGSDYSFAGADNGYGLSSDSGEISLSTNTGFYTEISSPESLNSFSFDGSSVQATDISLQEAVTATTGDTNDPTEENGGAPTGQRAKDEL